MIGKRNNRRRAKGCPPNPQRLGATVIEALSSQSLTPARLVHTLPPYPYASARGESGARRELGRRTASLPGPAFLGG